MSSWSLSVAVIVIIKVSAFWFSGTVTAFSTGVKTGTSSLMSFRVTVIGRVSTLAGVTIPIVRNYVIK